MTRNTSRVPDRVSCQKVEARSAGRYENFARNFVGMIERDAPPPLPAGPLPPQLRAALPLFTLGRFLIATDIPRDVERSPQTAHIALREGDRALVDRDQCPVGSAGHAVRKGSFDSSRQCRKTDGDVVGALINIVEIQTGIVEQIEAIARRDFPVALAFRLKVRISACRDVRQNRFARDEIEHGDVGSQDRSGAELRQTRRGIAQGIIERESQSIRRAPCHATFDFGQRVEVGEMIDPSPEIDRKFADTLQQTTRTATERHAQIKSTFEAASRQSHVVRHVERAAAFDPVPLVSGIERQRYVQTRKVQGRPTRCHKRV